MSNMTKPALTDVRCSRHRPAASQRRYGCKSTQRLLGLRRHDWSPWFRQRFRQRFRFRQRLLLCAHLLLFWQPASALGSCGDGSPSFRAWQASLIFSWFQKSNFLFASDFFFSSDFLSRPRRSYDTVRIFDKFQGRCPPPTPSTKCDVKAHVLRYLISESTCFEM